MWRYVIPVAVLAVLAAFFARGLQLEPSYIPSPLVGKPAPEFTLPALENPERTVSSEDLEGRMSLLNVWATWCPGCRDEHAFLMELSQSSGVPIYGLNWEDERDKALDWLERLGNPYVASGFDEDGQVAVEWGVYGAPETFLVDRDGTVLHKHVGPLTASIWREDFVPIIRERCGTLPCPLVEDEK